MNFHFNSSIKFAFVATALVSTGVFAQALPKKAPSRSPAQTQAAEKGWVKEPSSFLGIEFKKPLTVQNCPTTYISQNSKMVMMDFEALKSMDGGCIDTQEITSKYQRGDSGKFKLFNLPNLGFTYKVYLNFKAGLVTSFTMELDQSDFSTLLNVFKDRYGAPTSSQTHVFKAKNGGEFNATEVAWKGKNTSIYMYERLGRLDESHVLITDNEDLQAELDSKRDQRASESQKF